MTGRSILKRIGAVVVSFAIVMAFFMNITPKANAATKLSFPKEVTVKAGKSKTLKITAKGYTVKKVTCVSEAMNVTIKTTKKSVKIKAKKGTGGQSDFLVTTITAKKGKKTQDFTFYTNVKITGSAKKATAYISSLADLKAMDVKSNTKYVLKNDIDMKGWTPVEMMNCSIDGAGHTLKNLSVPFVGKLYGGTIENVVFDLKIDAVYEQWGEYYAAPIGYIGPGKNEEIATVKNCVSKGTIKLSGKSGEEDAIMSAIYVAGLVGTNPNNYGHIEKCVNSADITTTGYAKLAVGGIIGNVAGRTGVDTVVQCMNSGKLDINNKGFDSMGAGVGAIAGYGTSESVMRDCLNTGDVSTTHSKRAGGGIYGSGDQRLVNCVNLGSTSFGVVGGTVDASTISSWNSSEQIFKNVYFDETKTEKGFNWEGSPVEVPGVLGVSDVTSEASFAGLDFSKIWKMGAAGPELRNLP